MYINSRLLCDIYGHWPLPLCIGVYWKCIWIFLLLICGWSVSGDASTVGIHSQCPHQLCFSGHSVPMLQVLLLQRYTDKFCNQCISMALLYDILWILAFTCVYRSPVCWKYILTFWRVSGVQEARYKQKQMEFLWSVSVMNVPAIHASMHPCIQASMHPCMHASMRFV